MTMRRRALRPGIALTIGWLAVASSVVYFASDVLEAAHGGFTTSQLWLTLIAEATLPVFVIGLYAAQRPQIGKLGTIGAVGYATAYGYFTYTVVYALSHHTRDFAALSDALDPAMTIAGAAMVASGLALGVATYRATLLPRWTGPTLAVGVVLVAATINAPTIAQLSAVGVRDAAFVGMGLALVQLSRRPLLRRPLLRREGLARDGRPRAARGQP